MKNIGIIVALVGCLAFGNTVFSQDRKKEDRKEHVKKSPAEKAEAKTAKMTKELDLTDEQALRVEKINLDHFNEMDELHAEIKKLKEKGREMRESHKEEIGTVLTAEQKVILEKRMEERRKKREEHKQNCQKNTPPPPPAE